MLRSIGRQIQPIQSGPVSQSVAEIARNLGIRAPQIGRLAELHGPIVFGIANPHLVVPVNFESSFLESERTAVLFHEMEHLASRDPLWKLLGDLVVAVLWWHPLVWWMARQSKWASEEAADEACLSIPNGAFHLAQGLVRLADQFLPARVAAAHSVASSPNSLSRRVAWLLALEMHGRGSASESAPRKFFRSTAIVLTLCGALASSGFCRARASSGSIAGDWAHCWQQSFVCAIMNTLGGPQESERPNTREVYAAKTDESVADAIGLTGSQRTKYFELLAENRIRLKEFYKIKNFEEQREEGMKFNRWWRGRLKEILTPKEHEAYMKYWQDQMVETAGVSPGAAQTFTLVPVPSSAGRPRNGSGPQPPVATRIKKSGTPNWKEIGISSEQEKRIGDLELRLNPLRKELQSLKENGDKVGMDAKSQAIRAIQTRELKQILSVEQFEKYQKQLSNGGTQAPKAARVPVAAGG